MTTYLNGIRSCAWWEHISGSLESNLDELGRRFDRYPNFAVDVAARTVYLTLQPREKARQFLMKYQDRILYGTDLAFFVGQNAAAAEKKWANSTRPTGPSFLRTRR